MYRTYDQTLIDADDPEPLGLPLTFPDGTRRVVRNMRSGTALRFHYLARLDPLATLCGAPVPPHERGDTGDRYSTGAPLPICGHCKRLAP